MTAAEINIRFNIILDKVGQPAFKDTERTRFFNIAQLSMLDEYSKNHMAKQTIDSLPNYGTEDDTFMSEALQPFVPELTETSSGITIKTDADGRVTYADINTSVAFHTGQAVNFYHIDTVHRKDTTFEECDYVRRNDLQERKDNEFKEPTAAFPIYTYYDTYLLVHPIGVEDVKLSVIRYPVEILIDDATPGNNVDPEWPDKVTNELIFRALNLAGVSIREGEFYQMMEREVQKE